ncbi:circadian clock KaiB family protein [Luteolibacter arcticus]|uniref:Circadian clock KaiB family protein n=1 Tax=Luteolibacter arcticus TaxID=1581411 RepID=A0ABT3GDC1_9BACT|nr:circadian clock KaiB family protein [Luteolibacter arcticus]MCW1921441.1 circadian clock KaiB family protein [Luteolibacter arcticus]
MNDAPTPAEVLEAFEEAARAQAGVRYLFRLYVTGPTVQSNRAIVNTRRICEEHLKDRYDLEVVDICQHPELARSEQIIAAPTLVKQQPLPVRRFVGDMSRTDRLLAAIGLPGITPVQTAVP